ncbi:MAG: hypothetical protein ACE3JU_17190 [Paenibacillus sp.]
MFTVAPVGCVPMLGVAALINVFTVTVTALLVAVAVWLPVALLFVFVTTT